VARDRAGTLHGVGVARYATDDDDPTSAELAILVVDEYQGQGLGKLLVTRLAVEARARGILRLRALVQSDNDVVIGMLARHAPSVSIERSGDEVRANIPTQFAPARPVHAWAPF
jgi:GNAT superfamily N-acetyltransferase